MTSIHCINGNSKKACPLIGSYATLVSAVKTFLASCQETRCCVSGIPQRRKPKIDFVRFTSRLEAAPFQDMAQT
jgi:hypothetical protein